MERRTGSPSEWADLVTDNFISLSVTGTDESFEAALRVCDLADGVRLTVVRTGRSRVTRDHRDVRADASDDLLLLAPLAGTTVVRQEGVELVLGAGAASVHVAESPYELEFTGPSSVLVLQAPRRVVPSAAMVTPERRRIAADGAASRIFRAFAVETVDTAATHGDRQRHELAEVATSLAIGVLGPPPASGAQGAEPHRALLAAVRPSIRSRLSDPDLTPAAVAARHGVSLRTLQVAFAADGTSPAAFIRGERLARARRVLAAPHRERCRLGVVAAECGFTDVDVFVRAFRREFGETPGAWRAAELVRSRDRSRGGTPGSSNPG